MVNYNNQILIVRMLSNSLNIFQNENKFSKQAFFDGEKQNMK